VVVLAEAALVAVVSAAEDLVGAEAALEVSEEEVPAAGERAGVGN
jgi:hypothetical protein